MKAGNLVGSGEATLLTTVSQVDPIIFRGGISEADYLRLARDAEARKASDDGKLMKAELLLADGTKLPWPGSLDAVERAVDPQTGTLSLQISFPNPDRLLRHGQTGAAPTPAEKATCSRHHGAPADAVGLRTMRGAAVAARTTRPARITSRTRR